MNAQLCTSLIRVFAFPHILMYFADSFWFCIPISILALYQEFANQDNFAAYSWIAHIWDEMRKKWTSFVMMSLLPQFWGFALPLNGYNAKNGFLTTSAWNAPKKLCNVVAWYEKTVLWQRTKILADLPQINQNALLAHDEQGWVEVWVVKWGGGGWWVEHNPWLFNSFLNAQNLANAWMI